MINHSALSETLVAGRISSTDDNVHALAAGIDTLGHTYRLLKLADHQLSLKALLGRLQELAKHLRAAENLLDEPLRNTLWPHCAAVDNIATGIGSVIRAAESLLPLVEQEAIAPVGRNRRKQDVETALFVGLYDLYCELRGSEANADPFYRFAKRCAAEIDPKVRLPSGESFRKRIDAARERRGAERSVLFPIVVFPWKE
ncbi:MAG TPA: hypothetical protein VND87_12100 [Stellaceae bacterium]|nr:hypothetical protein [Stellaceae bacterium]